MNELKIEEDLWGYAKRLWFVNNSIQKFLRDRTTSDISVLDVGCGTGTQLGIPLARLGYRVTGIDVHMPSIIAAREAAKDIDNTQFIYGPVEEFTDKCDVVILSEVLEHVTDPAYLLNAAIQRMSKGGLLIVTVPNGYGEFEWDSWVFRLLGLERLVELYIERKAAKGRLTPVISSTENKENRHIQFFSLRRMVSMFEASGVEIVGHGSSTLLSGPFAGHLFGRFRGFVDWNANVVDKLPMRLTSGWHFALQRKGEET